MPHDGEPVGIARRGQNTQDISKHQYQADYYHTLMSAQRTFGV